MAKRLKIGQLSKQTGVSVETLRFYELQGLLSPQKDENSGYRYYTDIEQQKLSFILHAKKVGFALQEIKRLLALKTDSSKHTCEEVKRYTGIKIQEIEVKIRDLQKMKQALDSLHQACCGGDESTSHCTILNSLSDPKLFSLHVEISANPAPTQLTGQLA